MNLNSKEDNVYEDADFTNWEKRWRERSLSYDNSEKKCKNLMRSVNPLLIPRNQIVENTLKEANQGNLEPINSFLKILKNPFTNQKNISEYQIPLSPNESYKTFCGT